MKCIIVFTEKKNGVSINLVTVSQDELIKEISNREDIDVTIVRKVFKSAEDKIFAYLSSTTPYQRTKIKLLNGIAVTGEYIPSGVIEKGMFKGHTYKDKIKVQAVVSRNYQDKFKNLG